MRHLAFALVLLAAVAARADEWKSPSVTTIVSPNQRVQAVITPSTDGKTHASVAITEAGRTKKFALANKWMPVDAVVLDDGTLLAFDEWHQLGYGKVATLYERDGRVRWAKTLVELVGQSLVDQATHSVSSIWWRKVPLEWTLATDGKSGAVTLFDENQLRVELHDGASSLVHVAVTDDPRRLLNRANALVAAGKDSEAIPVFERAMARDPDLFEAFLGFTEALQRGSEHERVADTLERASAHWKLPVKDNYGLANVSVAWAKSLVALSRFAAAERVLRIAIEATPTYTNPPRALAEVLLAQKRTKDADVVLDELVARLTAATNLDTYGIADVGDFYQRRGELAKALAAYLKAYKPNEVTNQFLYASLAALYEQLGRTADAIRVVEQLVAHFDKLGSAFARDAKEARAQLDRLRARRKSP